MTLQASENIIIKNFESNAEAFAIPLSKAREIRMISTIKYKELYPGKEIYHVQNIKLWQDIIAKLQIDQRLLMGLFGFITLRFEDIKEINDLVNFMLKLAKVDQEQRSKVLDIFKLYASNSESDISTSATNLGIPRQFVPLILIAKKILDPKFVTDLVKFRYFNNFKHFFIRNGSNLVLIPKIISYWMIVILSSQMRKDSINGVKMLQIVLRK